MSLLMIGWLKSVKNKATVIKHSGAEDGPFPQLSGTENLILQKRMFCPKTEHCGDGPGEKTNPGQHAHPSWMCGAPATSCRRWMQMETAVPIRSSCAGGLYKMFLLTEAFAPAWTEHFSWVRGCRVGVYSQTLWKRSWNCTEHLCWVYLPAFHPCVLKH